MYLIFWKFLFCVVGVQAYIYGSDNECTVEEWLLPAAVNHPVTTTNPKAQAYFNLGLTYVYAFNHDFALMMFQKAAEEDPNLAMAYWGMALSLGQNINADVTLENEKRAYAYSQKALSLPASQVEQAYIQALAVRYSNDNKPDFMALRRSYNESMKKLVERYPEDLDATCLYVESIMTLNPWRYWTKDGKPTDGTLDAIAILESILKRNPYHLGANHYYIHAWEQSQTPERALLSAFRLTNLFVYSGHLLHMPCHIFIRCGYYQQAIDTSKRAIAEDWRYIQQFGVAGYPIHYLPHNYRVLAYAYRMAGDYEGALKTGNDMRQFITPYMEDHPNLYENLIIAIEANLYFERWNELLSMTFNEEDPFVQSYWHFARAMAYIHLGDKAAYQNEKAAMAEYRNRISSDNPLLKLIDLGSLLLNAEEVKGTPAYIEKLTQAVDIQDRLDYDEPPSWYLPLRLPLGNAYLEKKDFINAEAVFKKGLEQNQRNERLLNGLYQSLVGQNRTWDALWVERQVKAAIILDPN